MSDELEPDDVPTLDEWLQDWAEEVASGQSHISREEAVRRYYKRYGRDEEEG